MSTKKKPYVVQISRTETVAYEVIATDPQDAENRYLMDGEEIVTAELETTVDSVDQGTADEILG